MRKCMVLFFLIFGSLGSENAADLIEMKSNRLLNNMQEKIITKTEDYNSDAELKMYQKINHINPEVLKLLLPNITEEPDPVLKPTHCCYNGGTCNVPREDPSKRWCTCPANFTGLYCDLDVDECTVLHACEEHQKCENTYGSYRCHCEDGFVDVNYKCIKKTNCDDDPCLNLGDCVDIDEGKIYCFCRIGYFGTRCEKKLPECGDSACGAGDVCIATPVGYECVKVS